jgi:hypothetical protein
MGGGPPSWHQPQPLAAYLRDRVAREEGGQHHALLAKAPAQLVRHGEDACGQVRPVGVADQDGCVVGWDAGQASGARHGPRTSTITITAGMSVVCDAAQVFNSVWY